MRALLALGGALALAACAGGDRVTLLEPVTEDGKTGAVAVLDPQYAELSQEEYEALEEARTDLVVIEEARNEARLRRTPRVRSLSDDEAARRAELMADLPLEVASQSFGFGTGSSQLDGPTLDQLVAFLSSNIDRYTKRYGPESSYLGEAPGLQIEIVGLTDATDFNCEEAPGDTTECNRLLSERRAGYVFLQLQEILSTVGLDINMAEEVS